MKYLSILRENSLIYNKAELKYVRSKCHSIHGHAHEQIINRTALGSRTSRNPQWLLLRVPKSSHHSHRYLRERKKRTHFASCYCIYTNTQILQYLVKNTNKNFHQAANKQSFQKHLLTLLKRVRGKSNFLKDLRSNLDNWNKI